MVDLFDPQKRKIRVAFNQAASTYDDHASLQKRVGEKLIHALLEYKKESEAVIDLGCGTGWVTESLALKLKYKLFYAIDLADQLLVKAETRLKKYAIQVEERDFECFDYHPITFDLFFSNMSLQWSTDLKRLFTRCVQHSCHQADIAFSLPLAGTLIELQNKNHFYSFQSIAQLLKQLGFKELHYFNECFVFNFDSSLSALKSIKAVGAHSLFLSKKTKLSRSIYLQHPCTLTYNIGFFLARMSCL